MEYFCRPVYIDYQQCPQLSDSPSRAIKTCRHDLRVRLWHTGNVPEGIRWCRKQPEAVWYRMRVRVRPGRRRTNLGHEVIKSPRCAELQPYIQSSCDPIICRARSIPVIDTPANLPTVRSCFASTISAANSQARGRHEIRLTTGRAVIVLVVKRHPFRC